VRFSIPGGQLYFQVDGWGAANLGANPWWNGYTNAGAWSGDLNQAWVQGRFLDNQLRFTLGRQTVGYGNSRMLQLDGGSFPGGRREDGHFDGYVGVPTTQRFTAYGSIFSANPPSATWPWADGSASPGRAGSTTGVSAAFAWNGGQSTREDLALDLRFSPISWMYLLGYVDWSLFASNYFDGLGAQIADSNVSLVFPVTPHLQFTVEYTYTVPSLALPYNSILWVFRRHDPPVRRRLGAGRARGLQAARAPRFRGRLPVHHRGRHRPSRDERQRRPVLPARHMAPHQGCRAGRGGSRLFLPDQGYWMPGPTARSRCTASPGRSTSRATGSTSR